MLPYVPNKAHAAFMSHVSTAICSYTLPLLLPTSDAQKGVPELCKIHNFLNWLFQLISVNLNCSVCLLFCLSIILSVIPTVLSFYQSLCHAGYLSFNLSVIFSIILPVSHKT